MKFSWTIIFVVIGCLCLLAGAVWIAMKASQKLKTSRVCIGEHCFSAEIADNMYLQSKGLMHRMQLDRSRGMLFRFSRDGVHRFWMKNTLIPLDMIWADADGVIMYIEHNAQPCGSASPCPSYGPSTPARYVLEIGGGLSEELEIKVGDTLTNFSK